MPLADPEHDPIAQCSAQTPRPEVSHDPVSGFQIFLVVPVAAEMGHQAHHVVVPFRCLLDVLPRKVTQEIDLVAGEYQVQVANWDPTANKGHDHETPCDYCVDQDGLQPPTGRAEQQDPRPATGFRLPEVTLDSPALEVEPHELRRRLCGADLGRAQRVPLHRVFAPGRCALDEKRTVTIARPAVPLQPAQDSGKDTACQVPQRTEDPITNRLG